MFCAGGKMVIGAFDVSTNIYQLCWYYEYDVQAKNIVQLMIAWTQEPYQFADENFHEFFENEMKIVIVSYLSILKL